MGPPCMAGHQGVRWVNTDRVLYRIRDNLPGIGSEMRCISDTMLVEQRVGWYILE